MGNTLVLVAAELLESPNLTLMGVDATVAPLAAEIRATRGPGLADAIVSANSMTSAAEYVLTNYPKFWRIQQLRTPVIAEHA